MTTKLECEGLKYALLCLIIVPILVVLVITSMIPVADLQSPSFLVLLLSQFLTIFIHSHHIWFVFGFIVIGATLLWSGYFSDTPHFRIIGITAIMGIPGIFAILLYLALVPIDSYFLTYPQALISELVMIAFFMAIGLIMALLGKAVVGHFSGSCPIRTALTSRTKQVLAYELFVWGILLAMLIGVLLDYVTIQSTDAIITFFGVTATRSEWFQNLFLVGIFAIMLPTAMLIGYIGNAYHLKLSHTLIIIGTAFVIGSAIWDLLYAFLYPLPENQFYHWFDPFGLGFLRLTTFTIQEGIILMDAEFMKFFSYLRLLIFVPLLIIELWRFTK